MMRKVRLHKGRSARSAAQFVAMVATISVASSCGAETSGELQVAVASNFAAAMTRIAQQFEVDTGETVSLSFGSTGKHYAQIRNGAPYDVFFAADERRPQLLEEEGIAASGSRFTYAAGRLVLWSPIEGFVDPHGRVLGEGTIRFLAIANPDVAPYGRAAREVLQAMGRWDGLAGRIVRGENISQSFQFARSGNADLAFVAYSQVMRDGSPTEGSVWLIPDSLYGPIEQQAVLLRDSDTARRFLAFVRSEPAMLIIREYGYQTP